MFDVYVYLKNEAALLPHFLKYYGDRADCRRIVALDNFSDDGSQDILENHSKVEVRIHVPSINSYVNDIQSWQNNVWLESAGCVDYAILVTVDEWVGPDLEAKLAAYSAAGVTVLRPQAYDMISEDCRSPVEVRRGVANSFYSKPCVINPNAITSASYAPGTHDGSFTGDVRIECVHDLALYHFRYLGRENTWARYQALQAMLRSDDVLRGYGFQYWMTRAEFDINFDALLERSIELEPVCPPE